MGYHRYKTHEELVNTPGVSVDLKDVGFAHYTGSATGQSVIVDLVNNNFLGKRINLPDDQYFGDWFCIYVSEEDISSPPKESESNAVEDGVSWWGGCANSGFKYTSSGTVKTSIEDIDLKFRCIEVASKTFPDSTPDHLILIAGNIYKYIKQ